MKVRNIFFASAALAFGLVGFAPSAQAGSTSSFSFSYSEGHYKPVHYKHHKKAVRHHRRAAENHAKAVRHHNRAVKRWYYDKASWHHRKAVRYHRKAMKRAHRHAYHHWSYGPYTAVHHNPPVVYESVTVVPEPEPIYYKPTPLLANPSSPSYLNSKGQTCREYQSDVTIGGRVQPTYGTACLQSDGAWRIIE